MQSSGGILSAASAAREPVRTILSGPAGGVIGALSVARAAGIDRILTFDMGGTSTDVALLDATREPPTSTEGQVAGLPVGVPMLDIHTAGAGGGSLAWMDSAGALQVGPQSAGAIPGPACYGRGDRATVTDANLVLGRLHPDHFLGGAMRLDEARARKALSAVPTKSFATLEHLAEGILRVANARMESALRRVSVERGHDPRTFTLLAFGGAGPLHACALAESLGIRRVLIPAAPGALSALGILDADLRREFSRTVMLPPGSAQIASQSFATSKQKPAPHFCRRSSSPSSLAPPISAIKVRASNSASTGPPMPSTSFHRLHAQSYGYADPARAVEIVTLRVQAIARSPQTAGCPIHRAVSSRDGWESNQAHSKYAYLSAHRIFEDGRWRSAALYDRALLHPGNRITGPAVITELSATTYLPTGWTAVVDALSNLVLTPKSESRR